ncbi:MAG: hypothetical protein M1839_004207 [Geoglossum umbratile]|nr:MAG: hypothetical protein M1839_004207 [Geoglossum umbratile]
MLWCAGYFLALSALATSAYAETIHGVAVLTRHGDRTSKHYWNYHITPLGLTQNYQTGSYFRDRYILPDSPQHILNISTTTYSPAIVPGSAPNQAILINTATAFLQGLYPPNAASDEKLTNGSISSNPLGGYQYVSVLPVETNDEDTIWLKGSEQCPAYAAAAATYAKSGESLALVGKTRGFYSQLETALKGVWDYTNPAANLTFVNAYDIYDLLYVASIHNASIANLTTLDQMFQLRTLADAHEFALTSNSSQPVRSIGGGTFAATVIAQLNNTINTKGQQGKFSLMAGSYNTFQAFFALANLTAVGGDFFGLPVYASTMAFELFTEKNMTAFPSNVADLNVRFLFRNGTTQGPLTAYPLFGGKSLSLSWADFAAGMGKFSVGLDDWCKRCNATLAFCQKAAANPPPPPPTQSAQSAGGKKISNAVAGVIGAVVALAVVVALGVVFLLLRKSAGKKPEGGVAPARGKEEGSLGS